MRRSQFVLIMIFCLVVCVEFVWAQATQIKPGRKQTLNFEDELVEGSAQKPELFYLFQKKNFNYTRLIKLRENFLPEMRKTTEDIQRLRGGR
jgi:hypothetical protein